MTKRSMYVDKHEHPNQEGRSNRLVISPTGRRYLFVYPFVKTRAWYRLPAEERQLLARLRSVAIWVTLEKQPSIWAVAEGMDASSGEAIGCPAALCST